MTYTPKNIYTVGEAFDVRGGKLAVTYEDNSSRIINLSCADISGFDSSKPGKQTITAEYEGVKCTFNVTVIDKIPVSIEIVKFPKTEYTEGDEFSVKGGRFEITYNNNTSEIFDLREAEIIGYEKNKIGSQTVTIKYGDLTTTIDVTVEEDFESPVAEVSANPTKIWSFDNNIVVENGGRYVRVIDFAGRIIKDIKTDNDRVEIPIANAGIYIVKTATKSQKVIIR